MQKDQILERGIELLDELSKEGELRDVWSNIRVLAEAHQKQHHYRKNEEFLNRLEKYVRWITPEERAASLYKSSEYRKDYNQWQAAANANNFRDGHKAPILERKALKRWNLRRLIDPEKLRQPSEETLEELSWNDPAPIGPLRYPKHRELLDSYWYWTDPTRHSRVLFSLAVDYPKEMESDLWHEIDRSLKKERTRFKKRPARRRGRQSRGAAFTKRLNALERLRELEGQTSSSRSLEGIAARRADSKDKEADKTANLMPDHSPPQLSNENRRKLDNIARILADPTTGEIAPKILKEKLFTIQEELPYL